MGHVCSFYRTDEELTASLAPLLRARLGDGCHVIYVANTDTIDKAWQRMEEAGLHRSAYEGTGVLQIIPAQTGFLEGGPVSPELLLEYLQGVISAAKEVPDSRLCLFSEKAWMLSQGLETQELLNYESRVNSIFSKKDVELWCLYDQRLFSGKILLEVLATHPLILRNRTVCANPSFLPPDEYLSPDRDSFEFEKRLEQIQCKNDQASCGFQNQDIKDIFNRLPLLIHAHDEDGNYIFWNKESERILGYTEEDVVHDKQILHRMFPDATCRDEIRQLSLQERIDGDLEDIVYVAKDGTRKIIHFSGRINLFPGSGWKNLDAGVDVTSCRVYQSALDESRKQLRLIIENVPARFCLVDNGLRFRFVNSLYASWYGKQPEEFIGAGLHDVLSPEYYEHVLPYIRRTLEGHTQEFETQADSITEPDQIVRVHLRPFSFSDDATNGFVVMILDVSEQKAAEKALQETKRRLRTYLDEAPDLIFLTDLGGTIRDVNRRAMENLGYSHAELRGMHLKQLDPMMGDKEQRAEHERQLLSNKRLRIESILRRKNGTLLPVDAHASLIEFKGEQLVLAQARDISEDLRIRAEREELLTRFRVIFENSMDGILVIARQTLGFPYANPAIRAMLGYGSAELSLLHFSDIFQQFSETDYPEDDPLSFMLASKNDVCLMKKNGEQFYVDTNGTEAVIDGQASVVLFVRDATKRRTDEEQLRRSLGFQSRLFEVSPDAILCMDQNGCILESSARCKDLFGVENAGAAVGTYLREWLAPEQIPAARKNLKRVFAMSSGELLPPNRYKMLRKDGSLFYGSFHSVPWLDEEGRVHCIVSVVRDVTEEVKAAEELRSALEFQTRIMEASPDAITRLDTEGRIEFCSFQGSKLFGVSDSKIFIGTHARDWIDPEDHEQLDANFAQLVRARAGWKHTTTEYRFRLENGALFVGAISSAPIFDDNGKATGIVSIVRDVTEQKRMENQLRKREKQLSILVENLHEGLEVIDLSGRILFVNKKLCDLIGYAKEELLGRRFADFLDSEERRIFMKQVIKCNTSTVEQYEVQYTRKDGVSRTFMVTHHPQANEQGTIVGSFGLVTDVTEANRLAQLKDDVDRLIRNELRTPLKGIISLTHMMLMEKPGSRCADYATELNSIASNMFKFIDLSREIFHMEQGDYVPSFAWFDFRKIFRNINLVIRPNADVKLVRVIYHNDSDSGLGRLEHYGEEVLLESMLTSLIKNAVESSNDGDAVTIIFDDREDQTLITVHDSGTLTSDEAAFFFDKYSTVGKREGSGLARYSAKLIAEAHGGTASVESDKERGTSVTIVLPHLLPNP